MLVAMFAGLGNAPFHPVDFSILNQRVSAPRLGYAFSAHGLSGNLGWALTPVFLLFFTEPVGLAQRLPGGGGCCTRAFWLLVFKRAHLRTEAVVHHAHGAPTRRAPAFCACRWCGGALPSSCCPRSPWPWCRASPRQS
jgi:FSR family fosmidomycin resistance protein-like MFS transporter